MENVHNAIAWYQKKIGSYDKQLWEQSVEKKLQKQPPFVLHNAPRKKVRLKTEYIDVDLIRGSTFTKTKPQVPWVYITRKAVSRILFFPFYYNWWVTQTSKKLYALLLVLYVLQVVTVVVYLRNYDHSIIEDELTFTEVILPIILMFLLCLIHSQTVLAHITHKPPKRTKSISGVTRKPRPKKTSRKGRSSGNNSTCLEDGNTDVSRPSKHPSPAPPMGSAESHSSSSAPNAPSSQRPQEPQSPPSIDMEKNLLSRSVSDYDLKPVTSSTHNEPQTSVSLSGHHHGQQQQRRHHHSHHHHHQQQQQDSVSHDAQFASNWHQDQSGCSRGHRSQDSAATGKNSHPSPPQNSEWATGKGSSGHMSGCSYNLLDNLPNFLTVEKVCQDVGVQNNMSSEEMVDVVVSSRSGRVCSWSGQVEEEEENLQSSRTSTHSEKSHKDKSYVCVAKNRSKETRPAEHVSEEKLGDITQLAEAISKETLCDRRELVAECISKDKHCERIEQGERSIVGQSDSVLPVLDRIVMVKPDSLLQTKEFDICWSDVHPKTGPFGKPHGHEKSDKDIYFSSIQSESCQDDFVCLTDMPGSGETRKGSKLDELSNDNLCSSDCRLVQSIATGEAQPSCVSGKQWSPCAVCAPVQTLVKKHHPNRISAGAAAKRSSHDHGSANAEEEISQYDTQDSCDSGINESPSMLSNGVHGHLRTQGWSSDDQIPTERSVCDMAGGVDDVDNVSFSTGAKCPLQNCHNQCEFEMKPFSHPSASLSTSGDKVCQTSSVSHDIIQQDSYSTCSDSNSYDPPTVKTNVAVSHSSADSNSTTISDNDGASPAGVDNRQKQGEPSLSQIIPQNRVGPSVSVLQGHKGVPHPGQNSAVVKMADTCQNGQTSDMTQHPLSESSSHLQCFSELIVQEILNKDTLREMSCSSLLAHSDLENSSSSLSRFSTVSRSSLASTSSSSCKMSYIDHIPLSIPSLITTSVLSGHPLGRPSDDLLDDISAQKGGGLCGRPKICDQEGEAEKNNTMDESLDQINISDGERPSDDVSNYNPSDSDADSDGPLHEGLRNRCEEKWKRLRFQEQSVSSDGSGKITASTASTNLTSGPPPAKAGSASNGSGSRSVVGILTRKPSPLKDLAVGRKTSSSAAVANSSGSDQEQSETRSQLRRRRRTSGTQVEEVSRPRNVPMSLGIRPNESKSRHISSSENETGGGHTPEGSNKGSSDKDKATMSSEEWEDRIQSDETTSSAYSSNSEVDTDDKAEEEEEKTEYTTSTLHVINLLQPQGGSPTSSGNVTQPDKVSCVIWEGNECKKVDLTALDIGWAIIDKVDGLPESSDYFVIGLLISFIMSLVPLVFRVYANKEWASFEDLLTWTWYFSKLAEIPALSTCYSWRQYLMMVNGILQRFFLSLLFFFLLSVADRTFKQRLLYAKHFSYLTSSRRARKFTMPHFRLNKVRNIKIWLSLRSYLKRRGPQRSVDVIVSACFLCAVCTVCLISLQMLKDTDSYLDYLCNWELLVWCVALAVFLMRFMTVGLKINKKYRNLSVLITEQINLYLQMEQKPHKKEELILANNVLRLAEDLLKELESPFKISGFSANPLIYNIMRVVVLSAFSAVLTEVLGFKLKLHKIKLKG